MSLNQGDYNRGGLIAFAFSMVVSLLLFVYVSFFSGGVDLKEIEKKEAADAILAGSSAGTPEKKVDVSQVKEPWMSSEDMIAHGKKLYQINCSMCHGAEGRGDGVAGANLNPKPRNFVEGKWKLGGSRLDLFKTLSEGIAGTSMQAYAHLTVVDRWALVHHIRSITEDIVEDQDSDVAKKAVNLK